MDRASLITVINVLARPCDHVDHLEALLASDFSEAAAHRSIAFVPLALARPILEKLEITNFSQVASILLGEGSWLDVRLADQPEYVAALAAARDHLATGSLPREAFRAIALASSDVGAVNEALNHGADITGATIATAFHDSDLARYAIR